jgi:hypothetical protein
VDLPFAFFIDYQVSGHKADYEDSGIKDKWTKKYLQH